MNSVDLDFVMKKDYLSIWEKYHLMFYKVFDSLSKYKYNLWQKEDEWLSFCYEMTIKAVDSIKPEKIKKSETWTIYIQLYRFVSTYAKREIIREVNKQTFSLEAFTEENEYENSAAACFEDDFEKINANINIDILRKKAKKMGKEKLFEKALNGNPYSVKKITELLK